MIIGNLLTVTAVMKKKLHRSIPSLNCPPRTPPNEVDSTSAERDMGREEARGRTRRGGERQSEDAILSAVEALQLCSCTVRGAPTDKYVFFVKEIGSLKSHI